MNKYMTTANSKLTFFAEDTTVVLLKVIYNVPSNSVIGFTPLLNDHGISQINQFQTNLFLKIYGISLNKKIFHIH